MFELDGDFDLDEDFLEGAFHLEPGTKDDVENEEKGAKRSSVVEEFLESKKPKISNSRYDYPLPGKPNLQAPSINSTSKATSVEDGACDKLRYNAVRNISEQSTPLKEKCRSTPYMNSTNSFASGRYAPCDPFVRSLDKCKDFPNGTENVVSNITPQHRNSEGARVVQKRRFPGPAGLLPTKDQITSPSVVSMPNMHPKILHNEEMLCSQSSVSVFDGAAWQQMLRDFELNNNRPPLNQFTVAWVKRRAAARQLLDQKVPFLVTALRDLDCSSPDPCVVLHDRTGEIHGTLHREVWEQYGGQLCPGSILVLRQVGVLSTGLSARRHYLNVTCNNILSIYSNVVREGVIDNEVRRTQVRQIAHTELVRSTSDWQAKSPLPDNRTCKPVKSLFSTVGSLAFSKTLSPLSPRPNGWQQTAFSPVQNTTSPQTRGIVHRNSGFTETNLNSRNVSTMGTPTVRRSSTPLGRVAHTSSNNCTNSPQQNISESSCPKTQPVPQNRVQNFKGGFTPKVSRFERSALPLSPGINTSSIGGNMERLIDSNCSVKSSIFSGASKDAVETEESVLDVLEGLDTSSLFDDF